MLYGFGMKKLIAVIVLMMLSWHHAFSLDLNITLTNAGDLINQVDVSKLDEVESLTIAGNLNGTDILVIRKMINLKTLDMENANIVNGGSSYYEDYITSENEIGAYFFKENVKLEKVVLPKSLKVIGQHAFDGSESLQSVLISDRVGIIDKYAFYGCCNLTNINLPNTLNVIEECAFSGCISLSSINLPSKLYRIYDFAFDDCRSLLSMTFPSSIALIGFGALRGCTALSELYFEDSQSKLCLGAEYITSSRTQEVQDFFCDCPLEKVYLGRNLGEKGTASSDWNVYSAFSNQKNLKEVYIGKFVKYIGGRNFMWCNNIENVYIIDLSAWCKIDFSGNPLGYAKHLFLNNEEITNLTIPNDITEVKNYSFSGGFGFESITIHNGINSIGEGAFMDSKKAVSVRLAESITNIAEKAFYGCECIDSIISLNPTPPIINETTFDDTTEKKAILYVPNGCKNIYWLHPYWENFANIEEKAQMSSSIDAVIASDGILSVYTLRGERITVKSSQIMMLPKGIYVFNGIKFNVK